ncbi:MAG: hypothetical protein KatS3mg004_2156 [Bryobacteraceae bacterium]|nr:MAG: hypothetical protein KatS3mg004_2156 [Bryobacteraceae bacterium]
MRIFLLFLIACLPAAAQRDFLTPDEIEQLRLVQEPGPRLELYLKFARQRVDMLEQIFAKRQMGRSGLIHDTLEQITQIFEAMDLNIDDAIRRQKPLERLDGVVREQKELLARLEALAARQEPDRARYEFALDQALETLRDSIELNEQDLKERTASVQERDKAQREERERMLSPERKEELEKERERIEAEKQGVAPGKKKPTLLKPGEKPGRLGQPQQPPKK